MPDVVPVETTDESVVNLDALPAESADAPVTPDLDVTTWKKRLAGKDQALTAAQRERDAIKAERDALSAWKAEQEQANMTELQKLTAERDRLAAEATQARAEANAARLSAKYPLAADFLGDDLAKFDEVRVAEMNGRLAKEQADESEPEPRVDANNPRRAVPKAPVPDLDTAKAALVAAGNPFAQEGDGWGSTNPR